jgi:hypothetical protein
MFLFTCTPYTNKLSCIVKSILSWIDLYVYLLDIYFHFIYSNVSTRPKFDYCDCWAQLFFNKVIFVKEEENEDTIGVIRIRKSKYGQDIHQQKRAKEQTTIYKKLHIKLEIE